MKKLRWQILVVVITLILVGVLLLSQQPNAGVQTIFTQPTSGGVYTEALIGSMSRFNPLLDRNNAADRDVNRLLFSGLIRFDSRGMPLPDLAEAWGTSQDGTIYNFSIRPNAVWHDGTGVTTDDVIFTIDLIKNDISFYPADVKSLWDEVEIKRLDEKTMQFRLPEPFVPFLDYLTFGVLPQHLLGAIPADQIANADFNLNPIGSGPYQFDHLLVEDGQITGVVLTAFDKYHGQQPYIPQMVFRYYPSSASALDAYRQGEVLGISQITSNVLDDALLEEKLSLYTSRRPELSLIFFNLDNGEVPFFQDFPIRQALLMGLNRQRMINDLLRGQAIPADGPILPSSWAYYDGIEHLDYDSDAAISALKKEGYVIPAEGGEVRAKEGQFLAFTLLHPDDALHTALAEYVQRDWAKLGVRVTLLALPYEQLIHENLDTRQYQAALVDLNLSYTPDPDPYPFWHQAEATGGQNYAQWDSRAASEYLERARITANLNERARLYRNFQVIFAQELPALPLYFPTYTFAVDAQVNGVQAAPLYDTSDRLNSISNWHLLTRRALEATATPETP
ncbi:MAG: peptide ABC transporter substrate-binding protein [Anaerolineae bacterium]|jgi:peptide/nickel transport system substrate-binding protein|nr:peptide ABC transporter substrate-binding protein [Anaerolineae bacterium]MBT4458327.1 peptide ABC transporter substrate-binding protein [Anaerolineae bacterium]MBT4840860.1 peptide ABC transporter substrate-binding protein [Anaerolineae bacterium]MBT6324003.1 peptide ABC transporter substrate-binding protein [Anaerolineae bacterium]MBT6814074.1 peptide ABC transporter substrate-binding protein [Anaerolineae bacterium]